MSAQERVEYMDNQRTSMITEQIQKEKKIQRSYFKEQEAAGLVKPYVPPAKSQAPSLIESVGLPSHLQTVQQDPILAMHCSISKHMWTSNAGYLQRDGLHLASRYKQEFVWDQEELAHLKELGYLDKTHNRRRDNFVQYVEAAAKSKVLMKGGAGGQQ